MDFAKYGLNVKQNDPRMPPNPYVGYYGFAWLNGFEFELRRDVVFTPSTGGFGTGGTAFLSLNYGSPSPFASRKITSL